MTEVFQYHARCSQQIHSQMIRILEGCDPDIFNHPVDSFYQSIGQILNHCYIGDLSWVSSFRTIKEYAIYSDPVFDRVPKLNEQLFHTLTEWKENRVKLDAIILSLTEEIQPEDLVKTGSRVNRLGERKEKIFWKALLHMFNHQTHHRGQISQILDQLKIENDFSNMILL